MTTMGAMMKRTWDAWSGEWMGQVEDHHAPLPDTDHAWDLIRTALLVCSSACSVAAIWYAIAWGLPQ